MKGSSFKLFSLSSPVECQTSRAALTPQMVAFAGVFDGHDGATAAEYCSQGLLKHILMETNACIAQRERASIGRCSESSISLQTNYVSLLEEGYALAFHKAQEAFACDSAPPTFDVVKRYARTRRRQRNSGFLRRFFSPKEDRPGGTTACVLSIVSKIAFVGNLTFDSRSPMPKLLKCSEQYAGGCDGTMDTFAIVANCGDSRLLTDDGSGTDDFRQITQDHRPQIPSERDRLQEYANQGEAYLSGQNDKTRIFPGGLAVSRTIGDLGFCRGVIPTPDVFRLPLPRRQEGAQPCTWRFVVASDGLWDFVDFENIRHLAARIGEDGSVVDPKKAATKLIDSCVNWMDDVTILVIDVTV